MATISGSPRVIIRERDLSTRVPPFPGVYGGLVVPAKKGPIDVPVLVTSEDDFLKIYTPNEKLDIGEDPAMWSAIIYLQKSDKLWIKRAIGLNFLYSNSFGIKEFYSGLNLGGGISDEEDMTPFAGPSNDNRLFMVYAKNPGVWGDDLSYKLWVYRRDEAVEVGSGLDIDPVTNIITLPSTDQVEQVKVTCDVAASIIGGDYFSLYSPTTDYYVWFEKNGLGSDPRIEGQTGVKVILEPSIVTAAGVAGKIVGAVDAFDDFSATASVAEVTINNANAGPVKDLINGNIDTDAINEVSRLSVDSSVVAATDLQSKFFTMAALDPTLISADEKTYYVWYNVDTNGDGIGEGTDPTPAEPTWPTNPAGGNTPVAIEVLLDTADSATQIASKTAIAINAFTYFTAYIPGTDDKQVLIISDKAGAISAGAHLENVDTVKITFYSLTENSSAGLHIEGENSPAWLFEVLQHGRLASGQDWQTGEGIRFVPMGDLDLIPEGLEENKVYYLIKIDTGEYKLATTFWNALDGKFIDITSTDDSAGQFLIRAEKKVDLENSFMIELFKGTDVVSPVETHLVSRVVGFRDGFNRNAYIEDRLETSAYIRALDGPAVPDEGTGDNMYPRCQPQAVNLAGGNDGSGFANRITALEDFENTATYPMTILMDGGHAVSYYGRALYNLAEQRHDSFAELSVPLEREQNDDFINKIVEYRLDVLNANTSYGALSTPWLKIWDKFNQMFVWAPPSPFMGAQASFTALNYELWFPIGGARRGVLAVEDVMRRFSEGQADYLYNNGINPIMFYTGEGIQINGQKTLLARPSSLNRKNVRFLLVVIEPAIARALKDFKFEFNDAPTRSLVASMISSYMDGIKARRGVFDYQVKADRDNNSDDDIENQILNVWLFVKPTQAIEYIPFTTIITPMGLSFSLAASAV